MRPNIRSTPSAATQMSDKLIELIYTRTILEPSSSIQAPCRSVFNLVTKDIDRHAGSMTRSFVTGKISHTDESEIDPFSEKHTIQKGRYS